MCSVYYMKIYIYIFFTIRFLFFYSTLVSFSLNSNRTILTTANQAKFSSRNLTMLEECKCYAMCRKERIPTRMVWTCKWYHIVSWCVLFFLFLFSNSNLLQSWANDRTNEKLGWLIVCNFIQCYITFLSIKLESFSIAILKYALASTSAPILYHLLAHSMLFLTLVFVSLISLVCRYFLACISFLLSI